ncbi:MAG TPA: acyl-CoA dehydrogenase family protein, partial [Thermoanaerobaculia bacterium]|nr:acyl-CoA dehydrogenase family protein [Thermoanaerobaculia bacterium]
MSEPIPVPDIASYWDASPSLRRLVCRGLGGEAFTAMEPRFAAMGRDAAIRVAPLAAVADRESPRLVSYDALGRRVDRVEYHASYREMEAIAYGSGIVGLKYDPFFTAAHAGRLHLAGFTLGYLFGMAEMGLFCPVCMTDGVARVLTRHGTDDQRRRVVPRLASTDLATLHTGAMFLTERWGGSDVGANRTTARKTPDGRWLLTGEKWFCSNVDAKAILATARIEGAPEGTRGLSTFLLLSEGNSGIRIRRLKDKLGVRSMPTGEVELENAEAELVGGFPAIAEMLNLSRLYNSVASAAVMGRAALEARAYAEGRVVFSRPVASHPLAEETLLDLEAEHLFALHLAFEAVRALDRADAGDEESARLFRLLVPMVKAVTGKLAVPCVSEAMELVGGNGYIEESPLPRLLRDAQVLPIWEGTTNVLVLDFLRVARKEGLARPLLARSAAFFPAEARRM